MVGKQELSSFDVTYPKAFSCDRQRVVACFLEHMFEEHFRDRLVEPLTFMPDPQNQDPEIYRTVRHLLKLRADGRGTFTAKCRGVDLAFRIEDQGDHGITVSLARAPSLRPSPLVSETTKTPTGP